MKKLMNVCFIFLMLHTAVSKGEATKLLQQPAINENSVVFVYANDLWIADRDGGDATRLTSNDGAEILPHFSPDGKTIAFTAQYDGNTDVYTIPANGGEPRRITWHPGADRVMGWTPDGEDILFVSGREAVPTRESKFYKISKNGGMPEALPVPRAANGQMSPDGKFIAYQEVGLVDPEWRNYRAGQAKPIWIFNLEDHSIITTPQTNSERHLNPVWLGQKVFFLSERDFVSNIWSFDPQTQELKQETFHKIYDVKNLNSGPDAIVYEQGGLIHILDPQTGETSTPKIFVKGDFNHARVRWEDVEAGGLTNANLSPTGKRALFQYRGDIFTVPKEKGNWRNLTQSSGVADRFPVWSPNGGQIAWFSDKSGEYQLMIGSQDGMDDPKVIEIDDPTFFYRPSWSPDGKFISFTDTDLNLYVADVESGDVELIDTDRYVRPERTLNPVWSPDSKWIAYAHTLDNLFKAIVVYNVESGERIQITDGMSDAITPVWDESGKYLYFLASTDYGLNTGWLDMSSYNQPVTRALYAVVLSKEDKSPFLPESDEEEIKNSNEENEGEEKKSKKDKDDEKEGEKDEKDELTVKIDPEGILDRIISIDIPEKDYTGLLAAPENQVFYFENIPDKPRLTLHRYDLSKQKSDVFMEGISSGSISADRKSILYQAGSSWGILSTSGENNKPGDGSMSELSKMKIKVEPREEWQQIFREGWRLQRDFLYVDNIHGAPWDQVYKWYQPWVDHVRHRDDLNYVIAIMGGEVAVGHSYTFGGDMPDVERVAIGLTGADFTVSENRYQFAKIYDGENWNPDLSAPLSHPGLNISQGDFLLKVNGKDVSANDNLYRFFEGTTGRQTVLTVNDKPGLEGAQDVVIEPVSSERNLRMMNWVETNRRIVNEASDGKLAYVYVPNTSGLGYQFFNRYYFAQQDKQGAVIDERNNGGGSAADYMIDVMSRELQGYFNSKAADRRPFTTPMAGIWGPKVMIINERAGSGGDLLPYMFRKSGIGPLVGTTTWGGLVGIWDTPAFIDGGRMMAPRGGFIDTEGNWAVEAEGVAPDIKVEQNPKEVINGNDPQLERAIEEAMKLLETEAIELKPEPAPPVRYRRP